jgi:hypothetical protein
VVGAYPFTRGPAFGLRPHSGTIPATGRHVLPWLTFPDKAPQSLCGGRATRCRETRSITVG